MEKKVLDSCLAGMTGHYIPQLAALLISYEGKDGFKFNLKGIAVRHVIYSVFFPLLDGYFAK
jgi:hypothetical protein